MSGPEKTEGPLNPEPAGTAVPVEAPDRPKEDAVWIGMSLNWGSPLVPIQLQVELPFWVMMPECDLTVAVGDTVLQSGIRSHLVEIQLAPWYLLSHANALDITDQSGPMPAAVKQALEKSKHGAIARAMRTVVVLNTRALSDAVQAYGEGGRRRTDSLNYLRSLAFAHIPFVNKVVNAYRRVAHDPFAFEVSEWDLAIWFATLGENFARISLLPYADLDGLPLIQFPDGTTKEQVLTSPEGVQDSASSDPSPGEIELLDAWSLFFRGRFGDAIRSLITAVEITLESNLRRELASRGVQGADLENRLNKTWNDFNARLNNYLDLTKSRLPGPLVSIIPYINGVRLKDELERTRRLRHKVVHEGLRFDQSMRGPIFRSMETMTWLFDWFGGNPEKRGLTGNSYAFAGAMRGTIPFDCEYTEHGVIVRSYERASSEIPIVADPLRVRLIETLGPDNKDLELFALMCFQRLGLQGVEGEADNSGIPFHLERFYISDSERGIPVFLLDVYGVVCEEHLSRIGARSLALMRKGTTVSSSLCIINQQNGLSPSLREVTEAIPTDLANYAEQCGICLITSPDLLLLILGMAQFGWDKSDINAMLCRPGHQGRQPPGFASAGIVHHFYDKAGVISVLLGPHSEIHLGDTLAIRLRDGYAEQTVESMQVNRTDVRKVKGSQFAGIKTALKRSEVPDGSLVFVSHADKCESQILVVSY